MRWWGCWGSDGSSSTSAPPSASCGRASCRGSAGPDTSAAHDHYRTTLKDGGCQRLHRLHAATLWSCWKTLERQRFNGCVWLCLSLIDVCEMLYVQSFSPCVKNISFDTMRMKRSAFSVSVANTVDCLQFVYFACWGKSQLMCCYRIIVCATRSCCCCYIWLSVYSLEKGPAQYDVCHHQRLQREFTVKFHLFPTSLHVD